MSYVLRLLFVVFLICPFGVIANAADSDGLLIARSGDLPIILTAPHGGDEGIRGVPVRGRGTLTKDAGTLELTESLAAHLERTLGARPYVVAARFSRKYIDANRAESEAFDAPDAKPVYDAYHNQVRLFVAEIRQRFPQGALLLDIHGQSDDPTVLHRGTQNGSTVAALIRRHGVAALTGKNSIFGVMQARGFDVFPPNTPIGDPPENKHLNGGFTVQTYGSGKSSNGIGGIDAIQLEVGRDLRRNAGFTAVLGDAVAVFCKTYLITAGERDAGGAPPAK